MPEAEKVAAVRRLIPATGAGIYLNAGSVGPMSSETAAAMTAVADRELAVGRGDRAAWPDQLERLAEARAAVAAVLATDLERVALTHSTTDGLNLAVAALPWAAGEVAVTTAHEHAAVLGPLVVLRDRLGIELRIVPIADDATDQEIVRDIVEAAAGARAVLVSHVLWTTGRVMPVARVAAAVGTMGIWVVVDGAQGAGAIPARPDELGVDAYALSAQKWLLGPEGMGALWLGDRALTELTPPTGGVLAFETLDQHGAARWHRSAQRFEATAFHPPSLAGFARACGWLSMFVGLPWATARSASLAGRAADELRTVAGVTVITPPGNPGPLVTFRIAGWPAAAVVEELAVRAFALVRDIPPIDAVRLSIGWWNTEDELAKVVDVVRMLAAYTPDSLPRRRLAVLGADGRPID